MADIKNLHPKLQELSQKMIQKCKEKGIDIIITQGYRTKTYQDQLYAQGRTKPGKIVTNCRGGESPHCYGLAFDICIIEKGKCDWSVKNNKWYLVGVIGEKLGLEWGGRWTKFIDLPHYQYMFGLTIKDLQKGKKPPLK